MIEQAGMNHPSKLRVRRMRVMPATLIAPATREKIAWYQHLGGNHRAVLGSLAPGSWRAAKRKTVGRRVVRSGASKPNAVELSAVGPRPASASNRETGGASGVDRSRRPDFRLGRPSRKTLGVHAVYLRRVVTPQSAAGRPTQVGVLEPDHHLGSPNLDKTGTVRSAGLALRQQRGAGKAARRVEPPFAPGSPASHYHGAQYSASLAGPDVKRSREATLQAGRMPSAVKHRNKVVDPTMSAAVHAGSSDDVGARPRSHCAASSVLHLDGDALGRWTVEHLGTALSRPPVGITGVDPRISAPHSMVSPF